MRGRAWWAVGGGVVFGPVVGLVCLHTPPGLTVLRWAAERSAGSVLQGELQIGSVEGSPLGTLRLRNVRLVDRDGSPAAAADVLIVRHDVKSLLAGELHVRDAEVQSLSLDIPRLMATLPVTSTSASSPSARPLLIRVDRARLDATKIRVDAEVTVRELQLVASARVAGDRVEAEVAELRGRVMQRPFSVRGAVGWDGARFERLEVAGRFGSILVELAGVPTATGAFALDGRVRWPGGARGGDFGGGVLREAADLQLRLRGPPGRMSVGIEGRLAGARFAANALGPEPPWRFELSADGVDPRRFDAQAPEGELSVSVTATGALAATASGLRPEGRVEIRTAGTLRPTESTERIRIDQATVSGRVHRGAIATRARVDSTAGDLRASAEGALVAGTPRLERAWVRLRRGNLAAWTGPETGLSGVLSATVTARGPLADPDVRGQLALDGLGVDATTVDHLQARFRWRDAPSGGATTIHGHLSGLRHGPIELHRARFGGEAQGLDRAQVTVTATGSGPLRGLVVEARAHRTERGAEVRWSKLVYRAPRATWRVRPGRVRWAGSRWTLSDFDARSARGAVRARLDVDLNRPLAPGSVARVDVAGFDVEALDGLVAPDALPARGRLDAAVRFDARQADLRAKVDLHEVQWRPQWPTVTSRLSAVVTRTDAHLSATARSRRLGRLTAEARVEPPSRWRSPNAWSALTVRSLRHLDAAMNVDLARIPPLRAAVAGLSGRAMGDLRIGARGEHLSASLRARSLTAPDLPDVIGLELHARGAPDRVEARARAAVGHHRASTLSARLEHGLPELLRLSSVDDLRGDFQAHVDGFPLGLLGLRFAPGPRARPISGQLSLRARGGHSAQGPILVAFARGRDVRLDGSAPPLQWAAQGHLTRHATTATATLSAPELGRHRVAFRARTPARLAQLAAPSALVDHVESVALRFDGLAVSTLRALGVRTGGAHGRVSARLSAGAGLSSVTATVAARDLRLSPAVAPLDVRASFADRPRGVRLRARATLGGARLLTAAARIPLRLPQLLLEPETSAVAPVSASVRSDGFPLASALVDAADRRDIDGRLTVTASVSGPLAAPDVRAQVSIAGMRVGRTRFERFEVAHHLDSAGAHLAADLRQAGGGALRATARTGATDVDARVRARAFTLGFMSTLANLTAAGAAVDGALAGELTLSGTAQAPRLAGAMSVNGLRFLIPGWPHVEDGRLDVRVDGSRAAVTLDARSGPGRLAVDLRGRIPTLSTPQVMGTFRLEDVPIVAAGTVFGVDLDGQLAGRRSRSGFDAEVVFLDGTVRLPDFSPRPLHSVAAQADVVFRRGRWRSLFARRPRRATPQRYTVRLRTGAPIGLRGLSINGGFGVNLVARGDDDGVAVSGDVTLSDAVIHLFGRAYTVEKAKVGLSGRTPSDPRVDVRLVHKFKACTFFVDVVGSLEQPNILLSSQPDIYDDKQLFAFLFGATPDDERSDKTPAQQSLDLAAWVLLDQIQTRLRRALPFDTLAVDLGDGADSGQANVTLGKWLTDRLFVAYAYHHGAARDENSSEGRLRYRFMRSWLLDMVFGDRGNGGADVLWTTRW